MSACAEAGAGLQAERSAARLGDQGVVHLEELGGLGPAGQAQDPGERALPGLPGRGDHVVVGVLRKMRAQPVVMRLRMCQSTKITILLS